MEHTTSVDTPMVLIPFERFQELDCIPSSRERALARTETYDALVARGLRSTSLVVFVSHEWLDAGHPDRDGVKYRMLCEGVRRLAAGLPSCTGVYLWIDYCCVEQDEQNQRRRDIGSLPRYVESSDVLLTPFIKGVHPKRAGGTARSEELAHVLEHPDFLLFRDFDGLSGYLERAWCRLESFLGTHTPLPENGYSYFERLGVTTRYRRPHLVFGTFQDELGQLPEVGPAFTAGVLRWLAPLTVAADLEHIRALVDSVTVEPIHPGYSGERDSEGRSDGRGTWCDELGATYEGDWRAGRRDGHGVHTYLNATSYVGGWKDDLRSGDGEHRLSNGLRFVGSFHEGDTHGPGKLYYQNGGLKFDGTKDRAYWEGPIKEYDPSGRLLFEGTMKRSKRHGRGTEYADGRESRSGLWSDGEFVSRA